MASGAAIEGIKAHGLRWRYEISLGGQTAIMATMDDSTSDDAVEACARAIVGHVRKWLATQGMRPRSDELMLNRMEQTVDELEFLSDCGLDEVRGAMSVLFDDFDFYRICAVS